MSIELTWTKQDNSTDGNWEIYRSTDGTPGTEITGGLTPATTSYTDTAIDDGQEYHYTLRRNTDHASTDSTQVSIVAIIPTPTDFAVTVNLSTAEVTATWTDTVDGEINWIVQVSRDGGSTWDDVSGELAPNTSTYSENYIAATPTDWRVFITGDDTTGVSNTDSLTQTLNVDAEGLDVKLVDSDHNIRDLVDRDPDALPQRLDINREHTGLSDFNADVELANGESFLNTWKSRLTEVYAYSDQQLFFRGFMPIVETGTDASQTLVDGPDVLDILRRGEALVSYSNISYRDAIVDYWANHTDFDATVQPANPSEIVTNEDVFQADTTAEFQAETAIQDTGPFTATGNAAELEQTCFTVEGEAYDREAGTLSSTNTDRYSGGDAVVFDDAASAEYDFTTEYVIPSGSFGLLFRTDIPSDGSSPHTLEFELDEGQTGSFTTIATYNFAPVSDPEWFDISGALAQDDGVSFTDPGQLSSGNHTIRVKSQGDGSNTVAIDVLTPVVDTRYSYTIDNTLDAAQGALDGPEHYPTAGVDLPFNLQDLPFNIEDVIIDTTWNDTTEGQAIAASNDGGTTFTSASNTADATLTPTTVGTELVFKATLSGFGSQATTPKTGINGQVLSFVDVNYTGTDLAVIDDLTLRESDFRNLKRLHSDSNFRWEVDYREEDLVVESYPRGTTESATWRTTQAKLVGDEEEYGNRVVVNGANDARAVVKDDAEIAAKGEEVTVTKTDPTKKTDQACKSLARSILTEVTSNDELTGTVQTPPTDLAPGKRYTVPIFNNAALDLERVSYTLQNGALNGTLNFAVDPVLARQAANRERNIQSTQESI